MSYTILRLDDATEARVPFGRGSRQRIEGVIDSYPIALALMPQPGENDDLIIGPEIQAATEKGLGDPVTLAFDLAPEDRVDVPAELVAALEAHPDLLARWGELTPGRRRPLRR